MSCIQYRVFLCCVFSLYVVFLVSSIACFCVVFLFIRCVSCIQYRVFLCCVFSLYVVCLVSSIGCFCVVFLVDTLFVLYPVLRVSVLCFWFRRCLSCIQYYVFLCWVFGLYVVCLVSSITCFCVLFLVYTLCVLYPVLRVSVLCFWFIRCLSCIQ